MPAKPIRLARKLRGDSRGFGAMELALSLPFVLFLCLGMIEAFGLVATKIDYERAAQRTTDYAFAKRPNTADGTYLVAVARGAAGVPAENVNVEIFLECSGTRQSVFTSNCAAGQVPARFVSVEIRRAQPTRFDWAALAGIFGVRGFSSSVLVTGDSLVRIQ